MPFGENLKKLREEKGLTQGQLAKKIGVKQPMVAQYERYMKVPSIITGVEIAKALGTTCEELVQ